MNEVIIRQIIRSFDVNNEAIKFGIILALIPNNAFIEISLKGMQKIESSPPIILTQNNEKQINKKMKMYM